MEWKSPDAKLSDHVVICNCNVQVRRIVAELHAETVENRPAIVLVVQDREMWESHPDWHPDPFNPFTLESFFVLHRGRGTLLSDAIREVSIGAARAAVILADPHHGDHADARSTMVAVTIERENPQVHTVMELISSVNRAHLRATEVNEVVCRGEIAEKLIAQSCITPGVKHIFWSLLTNAPGTNNIYISLVPSDAVGSTFRELARQLIEARAPMILLGYIRPRSGGGELESGPCREFRQSITSSDTESELDYVINPRSDEEPGKDTTLQAGDQLIFIACRPPTLDPYVS